MADYTFLVTGEPGSGKTSYIKALIGTLLAKSIDHLRVW